MQVETSAIVLRTIKYGDTSLIVHLFTEALGKISLMFKGVRKTNKSGGSKANILNAGSILQIQLRYQEQRQWQIATNVEAQAISLKSTTLLQSSCIEIITEILDNCIRTVEVQEDIFECAQQAIVNCHNADESYCKVQPLLFCINLCKHLGFSLLGEANMNTPFLNVISGSFDAKPGQAGINNEVEEVSTLIHLLNSEQVDDALMLTNAQTRAQALDAMIIYLGTHIGHPLRINSLNIWRRILS
jgi:DNA repair protein RecO (recombination protein O)